MKGSEDPWRTTNTGTSIRVNHDLCTSMDHCQDRNKPRSDRRNWSVSPTLIGTLCEQRSRATGQAPLRIRPAGHAVAMVRKCGKESPRSLNGRSGCLDRLAARREVNGNPSAVACVPSVRFVRLDSTKDKRPAQFLAQAVVLFGGVDGARTRDPRRDRPVF